MQYYHGSPVAGITALVPPPGKTLYLTNNRAYALFYIRDLDVNWVTCGVAPDGAVHYDEQFPGQLRALYAGRSGWLYICEADALFVQGTSPWIVTCVHTVPVTSAEHIPDAHAAILREIGLGAVRVKRYEDKTPAQKQDIFEMMVHHIFKNRLLSAETPKARFMEQCFPESWRYAAQNAANAAEYITRWEAERLSSIDRKSAKPKTMVFYSHEFKPKNSGAAAAASFFFFFTFSPQHAPRKRAMGVHL